MELGLNFKLFCSAVAIMLSFAAYLPYLRAVNAGLIKPHVFSWVIWGTTAFIVFCAQIEAEGGMGAWPTGISAVITMFIAVLAFLKHSDTSLTLSDWLFFGGALASLPFWYITSDPLWTVIVLTLVDLLGFGPTFRKAYDFPYHESILFFTLYTASNIFALFALEYYSLTTVLFPIAVSIGSLLLISMVYSRRKVVDA